MPTRTARTTWTGSLQEGAGSVELTSSGAGTYDVSFPKRAADEAGGVTSPEELIAASHSSCFAMAFSAGLGDAGATNIQTTVTADVTLRPDPAGGFKISPVKLTVRGTADGIDAETFVKVAEGAKAGCPISKALAGVDIQLDAAYGA